jgi:large subunit ribosomal protein L29
MTVIAEFRGKTPDELKDKALELKKELLNLRFQVASGDNAGIGRFRSVRRDIARINTVLNEPAGVGAPAKKAAKPVKEAKTVEPKEAKAPKETGKETKAKKPATKKKVSGE